MLESPFAEIAALLIEVQDLAVSELPACVLALDAGTELSAQAPGAFQRQATSV